jgi:hypothetical protein
MERRLASSNPPAASAPFANALRDILRFAIRDINRFSRRSDALIPGFGGAGFSLWVLDLGRPKIHRLKPAPLYAEPDNHSIPQYRKQIEIYGAERNSAYPIWLSERPK